MAEDFKEIAHSLELQAEAIKGLAAIAEYLVASECADKEVINALHIINGWLLHE